MLVKASSKRGARIAEPGMDENVRDDQRVLLRQWRIPFRQVGKEISSAGIHDDHLLSLLHELKCLRSARFIFWALSSP